MAAFLGSDHKGVGATSERKVEAAVECRGCGVLRGLQCDHGVGDWGSVQVNDSS